MKHKQPVQAKVIKQRSKSERSERKGREEKKRRRTSKKKYRVRNWSEYNNSLVQRGSLELWVEKYVIKNWEVDIEKKKKEEGKLKRGSQFKYTDRAIETTLLIGKVYHQRLRQTEGFTRSIFKLAGLNLKVPDYSTLSRRGAKLKIDLPKRSKDKVIAIVDSTGFKVYGEGEWKVRKHGYSKRRSWVKLHISIDKDGEIRAALLTENNIDDGTGGEELLDRQKDDNIEEFDGDGGYDKRKVYNACREHNIQKIVIPPQRNAKIWKHGNSKGPPHPRDENLRSIRKSTKKKWKQSTGYHKRSLSENLMFRAKTIFGERVHARNTNQQITEAALMCKALNTMFYTGMPQSYAIA